ncbi:MAG: hypothetical protein QOC92_4812 [Acidimicrobiaceae bacterium]|jgi:hypothetical protein
MSSRTTGYRRTRWAAFASLGACAVTFLATAAGEDASAQAKVKPGRGLAIAETEKIDPRAGSLSLGITTGRSIAGHQNTVAQASSQAYDYGVIGSTAATKACDGGDPTLPDDSQPHAIQVDSRQANSTQDADEDKVPVPAHKHASANPTPFGESETTTAPQTIGPLEIGGGVAKAHSGLLDDGTTREASAVVDISGISIPLAGISMSSLHWDATWRSTDPENGVIGVFSIGSASIAGSPIPTTDPTQVLLQMNGALAPIGLAMTPPQAHKNGDVIFVDPMGISVFPSTQRDALVGGVLGGAQPVRQDVFAALLEQDCSNATPITIFDIIVGSMTGAGSFSVVLGGVQASSGDAFGNSFCLGCGGTPTLGVNTPSLPSNVSNAVSAPTAGGTVLKTNTTPGPASTTAAAAPAAAKKVGGKRGGALAGVGLAGLGMIAAMAEGDRRKMRRAQREIPQFEE